MSLLDGYRQLAVDEVWTNGSDLVVLGTPPNEPEERGHDCDAAGCGLFHVLVRGRVDMLGCSFDALPYNNSLERT